MHAGAEGRPEQGISVNAGRYGHYYPLWHQLAVMAVRPDVSIPGLRLARGLSDMARYG